MNEKFGGLAVLGSFSCFYVTIIISKKVNLLFCRAHVNQLMRTFCPFCPIQNMIQKSYFVFMFVLIPCLHQTGL